MGQYSVLDRLSALDTNTVSDALDSLSIKGASYGLQPLWDCPKVVGRASTIKVAPKTEATALALDLDEATTDDRIIVISGSVEGILCCSDIINSASKIQRIRGVIINGVSRDMDGKSEAGYPVYGRGVTATSERNQAVQVDSGMPLQMRGVMVHQDDYVIADSSGTVFVPAKHIEEVLETGERINRCQTRVAQSTRADHPVSSTRNPNRVSAKDQELVALFADSSTPGVSDALDKLGIPGQAPNIMPLTNYKKLTVGPAFTVRYVPASDPSEGIGDFIDDVAMGDVVVIDNSSRTDCTVWGDIMTQYAGLRGIAGTVIDGVCRDVNRALADDYPLFTVGRWMRTGKDRVQVGGVNESIAIGKVRVNPRDIVVADANGVVIVPRGRAREVAEVARRIEKSEANIREMIAGGVTLAKAREKFNYHLLQRKG